jgi:hypothetical protein
MLNQVMSLRTNEIFGMVKPDGELEETQWLVNWKKRSG